METLNEWLAVEADFQMQVSEVMHGLTQKSGEFSQRRHHDGNGNRRGTDWKSGKSYGNWTTIRTEVFATRRRSKTEAFSTQWRNKTESLPSVWRKSSHFEMSSFHRLAYTEETGSSEAIWSLLSLFA